MNIPTTFEKRPTVQLVRAFGERDTAGSESLDQPPTRDYQLLDSYSETVSEVVEKVGPTVVNIRARLSEHTGRNGAESA